MAATLSLYYDASAAKPNLILPGIALFGLTLWLVGIVRSVRGQVPTRPSFLAAGAILWVLLAGGGAANVNYQIWRCRHWIDVHQYEVVEGPVSSFHPMPSSGHDTERFEVNGVRFEYSDADISRGGFNETASRGGPIENGRAVRIAHREGRILKLWIGDLSPR